MEAASEKPKRGRPQTVRHFVDGMRHLWPDLTTDRAHANRYYAVHATGVLKVQKEACVQPAWEWLCPDDAGNRWKWDLLAALGRIKNDTAMRIYAERVCELKRPVKESIGLVRQWEERRQSIAAMAILDGKLHDASPSELAQLGEDTARRACQ
jgi:hypothetical protein